MKTLAFLASIFVLFSCQTKTAQKTENTDSVATATTPAISEIEEAITFGFSNEKGNQILAFEENTNPKLFTQTLDSQGTTTTISFVKTQKGNDRGVNQTYSNFDNCTGQIFVTNGEKKVNPDLTSVLFNEEFVKNHLSISVKTLAQPTIIDSKIKTAIENERKRTIKSAWKVANLGENLEAYIVVFSPKKDSVLASLVIGGKQFIYRDYPAKYDVGSTWRVDDGGEFPNDAIRILAVFRNQQGDLEIITEWAGAEGANIEYDKANKNIFEIIKEASRYWGAG